jgi:hypothetical protein
MKVSEEELIWQLQSIAMIHFPARIFCEEAWKKKDAFHSSGMIIYLENYCPFASHMTSLE